MFKKAFKAQNRSKLKRSDVRRFRAALLDAHPHLTDPLLSQVLPPKADIEAVKLGGGSRTVIYFVDGQPLFFDPLGREEWVPTVYALWKLPELLPTFVIHAPVFSRLLNGADLMLQGVIVPKNSEWCRNRPIVYGRWKVGSLRALCVKGNKAPIGVGHMLVSSEDVEKSGLQGRGVEMLHLYQDKLWEVGMKEEHPFIPDERFIKLEEGTTDEAEAEDGGNKANESLIAETEKSGEDAKVDKTETTTSESEQQKGEEAVTRRPPPDEDEIQKQDALLHYCFFTAIKGGAEKLRDKDLPILANVFFSDFVLPARPEESTLEIKRTTYKKFNAFLAKAAGKGLIQTKETSPGVVQITAINRAHDEYREFRVNKDNAQRKEENGQEEQKGLRIEEVFKFPSALKPLIPADLRSRQGDYWRMSEAKDLLWRYVNEQKLVPESNKRMVMMDEYLAINVMGKKSFFGEPVDRKTLAEKFLERLKVFSYVSRDGVAEMLKGPVPPVLIRTEQRQGRKVVTVLSGMEAFMISPDSLRQELAKKFAASTSLGEMEGKKNEGKKEILVQGDVIKPISELLLQKYHVPKKCIQVMAKASKKGRGGR